MKRMREMIIISTAVIICLMLCICPVWTYADELEHAGEAQEANDSCSDGEINDSYYNDEIVEELEQSGPSQMSQSVSVNSMREYCAFYDIPYYDSLEYKNEIKDVMEERSIYSLGDIQTYTNCNIEKIRDVPEAGKADIIWTNNPLTPWNHVGIYTSSNHITEALSDGVSTRTTGIQKEFAFRVYKVVKNVDQGKRYSKEQRKEVADYALEQVGKPYDWDFKKK